MSSRISTNLAFDGAREQLLRILSHHMIHIAERANLMEGQRAKQRLLENAYHQWSSKAVFEWKIASADDHTEILSEDYEFAKPLETQQHLDQFPASFIGDQNAYSPWEEFLDHHLLSDGEAADSLCQPLGDHPHTAAPTLEPQMSVSGLEQGPYDSLARWSSENHDAGGTSLPGMYCDYPCGSGTSFAGQNAIGTPDTIFCDAVFGPFEPDLSYLSSILACSEAMNPNFGSIGDDTNRSPATPRLRRARQEGFKTAAKRGEDRAVCIRCRVIGQNVRIRCPRTREDLLI